MRDHDTTLEEVHDGGAVTPALPIPTPLREVIVAAIGLPAERDHVYVAPKGQLTPMRASRRIFR